MFAQVYACVCICMNTSRHSSDRKRGDYVYVKEEY